MKKELKVDAVVLALGAKSENNMFEVVKNEISNTFLIGDHRENIAMTTKSAFDVTVNKLGYFPSFFFCLNLTNSLSCIIIYL